MQTKEQKAAYDKIRYAENREKYLAQAKAWQAANPEKLAAKRKAYAAANRKKLAAKTKAYRQANPEKFAACIKAWQAAHPNKCLALCHKHRAKKFGVKIGDTAAILIWLEGWKTEAPVACHYCKAISPGTEMTIDHVIALSAGGDHDLNNLVVCCPSCNSFKGDKLPEVWLAQINL